MSLKCSTADEMSFQELLATSAGKIRVTDESPPRYSITDIIGVVYGEWDVVWGRLYVLRGF